MFLTNILANILRIDNLDTVEGLDTDQIDELSVLIPEISNSAEHILYVTPAELRAAKADFYEHGHPEMLELLASALEAAGADGVSPF